MMRRGRGQSMKTNHPLFRVAPLQVWTQLRNSKLMQFGDIQRARGWSSWKTA